MSYGAPQSRPSPHSFVRFAIAWASIFLVALLWNGLLHLVILRRANEALDRLRRTDLSGTLAISLLVTAAVTFLFVGGYVRFVRSGSPRDGLVYGLFIGILVALLVDVNQYLLYPLPASLVAKWFAGGILEFTLYGVIVSGVYRWRPGGPAG